MLLLDTTTSERYLRDRGELDDRESVCISELSGGVSNQVLLVERGRGDRFVLKQAREQLRVQQEWKCDVRRIWREMDVLRLCGDVLSTSGLQNDTGIKATVPEILFEDRDNFCYAMTAAPQGNRTWKEYLLSGQIDLPFGMMAGRMLGALHAGTWRSERVATAFDDRSYFDALRVDPYYRRVAEVHPQLRSDLTALIESVLNTRLSLVHGDFSPKNLLVSPDLMTLIDFEVGHFGDPAFDNGFLLAHLALKTIKAESLVSENLNLALSVWNEYRQALQSLVIQSELASLEQRTCLNLGGCLLARIDGKSQVDYLNNAQRERTRKLAFKLLKDGFATVIEALNLLTVQPT